MADINYSIMYFLALLRKEFSIGAYMPDKVGEKKEKEFFMEFELVEIRSRIEAEVTKEWTEIGYYHLYTPDLTEGSVVKLAELVDKIHDWYQKQNQIVGSGKEFHMQEIPNVSVSGGCYKKTYEVKYTDDRAVKPAVENDVERTIGELTPKVTMEDR